MRNLILVVVLLPLASSCGRGVDPAIQPYVSSFLTEGAKHGQYFDPSVVYAHFTGSEGGAEVIGTCNEDTREILILKSYWDTATVTSRENVVWHELGHCLLGRLHRLDLLAPDTPVSIMYPRVMLDSDFTARRTALADEMFAGTGPFFGPPLP